MAIPEPNASGTALVTGASSGIGAEIARELARRGHGVTLVARTESSLRALADELTGAHGVRTEVVVADLGDPASRSALLHEIALRGLTVDVLVNNAGYTTTGPVAKSDVDAELDMVEVNVAAVVELCARVVPGMVERGRGGVLNVASTVAFQPMPGQAGYGATKAFVLSYTEALRAELRSSGVSATALCPGPVETGFEDRAGIDHEQSTKALPSFMWVPADEVARAGVAGLDKGRGVVIPGAANLVGAYGARLMPKSLLVPVLARQHPALRS